METNHDITTNDLLSIMGNTAFAVTLMLATIFAFVLQHFVLSFVLLVFTFHIGSTADAKYNEIRTKLGIR